ncbi:pickpocket protein 28-like [Macrosteles quadrilineatus]|uniref:pickpocket protein 28-like n=1 Tax=Macrosteles quadrilineatus TaxID=74068 RepID=UPI0023E09E99|nr:pickpocket protein 28-like [Macrosteles quadrilineatus]
MWMKTRPSNQDLHHYNTRHGSKFALPVHQTTLWEEKKPSYTGRKLTNHLPDYLRDLTGNKLQQELKWWVLTEDVFFQHSPQVSIRCCKIGGVGWVRKVCSKGDETVAKGLSEESNVVNGSLTGCAILLEPLRSNRCRKAANLASSHASERFMLYSVVDPDLAPSDFHLFPTMKKLLAMQRFDDDAQLQEEVTKWLKAQAAEFYDEGISKLVRLTTNALKGYYVKKKYLNVAFIYSVTVNNGQVQIPENIGSNKEKTINIFRSFWLVLFLLSIAGSAYMIRKVWQKWQDSPVIVSFSESWTPVWQIPFPAVTICSEAKSKNKVYNITEAIYKNMTDPDEQKILDAVSLVCDNHVNWNSPNMFIDENGINHITRVSPSLDDVLFLCRWKLGAPVNCAELFVPVMTEEGQCFSFNILHNLDSYRENLIQYRDLPVDQKLEKYWNLGDGYDIRAPLDVYPKRALGAGAKSGLFIVLRTYTWDLDYYCRGPVQGYKIKLHNPAEIPQIGESYFRVPLDSEIVLSVKANMMTTSESLLNYSPNKRQCFFPFERYLKYFKVYTQNNCQLECLTNYTLHQCNCVKFYMPRSANTQICGAGQKNCTINALDSLNIQQITEAMHELDFEGKCNCLPSCTSILYDAETSQAPFDYKAVFGAYKENETDPEIVGVRLSRVSIYFKESQFITSRRRELIGYADFLSQCGGLLGLFSGFSIMSLVEIIYYVTLRLWYNRNSL